MVSRLGLTSRTLLTNSFVILVLALMRLGVNWVLIEDQVMEEILLESRTVAHQAHIVLKQSAQIHAKHLETLRESERITSQELSSYKYLSLDTMPIHVTKAFVQQGLKSEHYDFRVIRENTSNQAVLTDLALLNQLREDEFNELFEVDEKQNVVHYVSPIRVEQECLVCHGATESLDQDPSGIFKNELHGWKVGEIQGAFAVIVDHQFISDRFEETILKTLLEDLIALCCVLVIAFLVTHSILKQLKSFFHSTASGNLE
jgi:hypothetical protein